MSVFDMISIIIIIVIGVIGGTHEYVKSEDISESVGSFFIFLLIGFMTMFVISIISLIGTHSIEETTKIPIIVEKVNKDDMSIFVKEENKRYMLTPDEYSVSSVKCNNYKVIIKTKDTTNFAFSFMKDSSELQTYIIDVREFKEITK